MLGDPMSAPLPIFELRQPFTAALLDPALPNLLIKAPTGSGKSTQIPQFVLDSGILPEGKRCVVLQPRRIAARMLAQRVARERNARLGGEVGYQVRFENITSRETRLTYVTEGVMLRMLLEDPLLDRVGCICIDEFHERHLDGDLVLAFARRLQRKRPDLKIIVMSATLVPGPLVDFMQPCKLLESEGRTFPVEIRYQAPLQLKTATPSRSGIKPPAPAKTSPTHPASAATCSSSCPAVTRSARPSPRFRAARFHAVVAWCHCMANSRRRIRTPPSRPASSRRSSSAPTSPKPRSPSKA
jgi:HrpA-like RNA helicase